MSSPRVAPADLPWFDVTWFEFPWAGFACAALVAWLAVLLLRPLARRVGWVDRPDRRKAHDGEVPLIGGWAIFIALAVVLLPLLGDGRLPVGYAIGALLLFTVSVADDRFPIRARYRFAVQLAAAISAVLLGGAELSHLGGWLPVADPLPRAVLVALSVLGIVTLINAVNFTDGIDGLCGGLGLVAFGWFAVAVGLSAVDAARAGASAGTGAAAALPVAAGAAGALVAFLGFNLRAPWRPRAVIFMGDSGSTVIGFTLAWLAIVSTRIFGDASVSPVACLWIMAVPLADAVSCIVRRVATGVTPMTADLKHLHHLLARRGLTPGEAAVAIHGGGFACGLVGVGGWWLGVPDRWLFVAFLVALAGFVGITVSAWRTLDGLRRAVPAA